MAKAITLIRCLMLAVLCSVAITCSAQMPFENLSVGIKEVPVETITLPIYNPNRPLQDLLIQKFNLSQEFASRIVRLAKQNEYPDFPKVEDILAIIEIESSYRPEAIYMGCYGLMMIQKKSHMSKLADEYTNGNKGGILNPEVNISIGAKVLNEYFNILNRDKKATTLAWNSGVGNYQKKRYNIKYYLSYQEKVKKYRQALDINSD